MLSLREQRVALRGVAQQDFARRRESDVSSRAIEELNAEVLFERLNLQTHGRLSEEEVLRRLAEAKVFGYRREDDETEVFKICMRVSARLAEMPADFRANR